MKRRAKMGKGEHNLKVPCWEDFQDFLHHAAGSLPLEHNEFAALYTHFFSGVLPELHPKCWVLAGAPGAGKTSYRTTFLAHLTNVHIHNMDEVMERLPGYQNDYKKDRHEAFTRWWPVAQEVGNWLVRYAFARRLNVVYDRTCGADATFLDLKKLAQEQTYTLVLYGFYVPVVVAIERVKQRTARVGQVVTEEIVAEYAARISAAWPHYLSFIKNAVLLDNQGNLYQKICEALAGDMQIYAPAVYQAFLQEGADFKEHFLKLNDL